MSIFENKLFQWIIVLVAVAFLKATASAILGVSLYRAENFLSLIELRNWPGATYFIVYDIGEIAKAAFLLRAVGFIDFVKG